MGVAAAFIFPASLAILTSIFPDHAERQKALGVWGATSGIAVAFGPIAGGSLLEHFWYGSIFLVNVPIVVVTLIAGQVLIPRLPRVRPHRFDVGGVVLSTAGVASLVLAIIQGPQWGWAAPGTLVCFAAAAVLLTVFTLYELRIDGPLLDIRVFRIPRFTGGALSISVAFFCLFGFIFLITQYFQFVKGYSTLSAGVHTLPFAIVAAVFTPIAAVVALKIGARSVVTTGLLLMGGGLLVTAFNSQSNTPYFGPLIVSMVLLALGLSSITAPTAEAVMGSVPDEQRGAAAGVNNTTRELGGTLGVAVFGSIFASSYAPKIISSFRSLPIPAGPKAESHQSVAAALAVIHRAPHAARPALETILFHAFHSGLMVACIAGAGVAVVGAVAAYKLLPGRERVAASAALTDGIVHREEAAIRAGRAGHDVGTRKAGATATVTEHLRGGPPGKTVPAGTRDKG
jgi:EmrB/QacA subfamily drug resistance transporter